MEKALDIPGIRIEIEDETPLLRECAPGIVPFLMEEGDEDGQPILAVEIYRGIENAAVEFLR